MMPNALAFEVTKRGPDAQGSVWIDIGVLVDGEPFGQVFVADVFAFARSCQSSGEMDLFTCGCGISMCAGIYEGIRVTQGVSGIEWQCPDPLADVEGSDSECPVAWRHFSFDPDQYAEAVEGCIARLVSLAVTPPLATDFPVHGWTVGELVELDTRPFSSRLPGEGRRIVARTVAVDSYVDRIVIGGNSYPIADLRLPADLLALNRERKRLRTFPESVEGLPAYEAYLDASRKFCSALRDHVGGGTLVRLTYHPPECYNGYAWEMSEKVR